MKDHCSRASAIEEALLSAMSVAFDMFENKGFDLVAVTCKKF
jgi:hypothetical protein